MASLLGEARERVQLDDFGDPAFAEALELLVTSALATGALNATGRRVLRHVVVRHLVNRLHVADHVRRHPEVATRPLQVAVVVTGLPRTGTTLLHHLLACDPRARVLRLWEALHPVPPERPSEERALVAQAERWLERFYKLVPGFRAIHPVTAEGPEECDALLQNDFASQHFDDMFDARRYSSWLGQADLSREYRSYALQLRILTHAQHETSGWVLKSPSHLGHLGALLGALPGALVVHCHRHPADAIPSYASLVHTLRRPYSDHVCPSDVGRQCLERGALALRRALEARDGGGEGAVIDVAYRSLVGDPRGVVAAIYERLHRTISPKMEARMETWLAANPRNRHGAHDYDAARFDLGTDALHHALAPYLDRFAPLL